MKTKFSSGAVAYTQNGRRYVVDEVEDGVVYCSTESGAETEFSETDLFTEAEWAARSDDRSGLVYAKVKRGRPYAGAPPRLDAAAAEQALAKVERLMPRILDFAALTIAARILADSGDAEPMNGLSAAKCREIFDAGSAGTRASILASLLGTPADRLVDAGRLGDNLMRAMLDKGMESHAIAFTQFRRRSRD